MSTHTSDHFILFSSNSIYVAVKYSIQRSVEHRQYTDHHIKPQHLAAKIQILFLFLYVILCFVTNNALFEKFYFIL